MSKFLLILHPKPLNKVMEKVETSHPAELNFCLYSYSSVIYWLNHGWIYFVFMSDHYVMVTVCQQACLRSLSMFGTETLDDFVREHYNYLQFSYYNGMYVKW